MASQECKTTYIKARSLLLFFDPGIIDLWNEIEIISGLEVLVILASFSPSLDSRVIYSVWLIYH